MKIKQYIMVNGQKIIVKGMEEAYKYGQMEANMKDIGKMIKQMYQAN